MILLKKPLIPSIKPVIIFEGKSIILFKISVINLTIFSKKFNFSVSLSVSELLLESLEFPLLLELLSEELS